MCSIKKCKKRHYCCDWKNAANVSNVKPAVNVSATSAAFELADTKLYVPVVTLSKENDKKTFRTTKIRVWDPNCVLCTLAGASTFTITDAKLYVTIVTLSTEDNAKLSKLLSEGFKRPVYWNECSVIEEKSYNANALIRESIYPRN